MKKLGQLFLALGLIAALTACQDSSQSASNAPSPSASPKEAKASTSPAASPPGSPAVSPAASPSTVAAASPSPADPKASPDKPGEGGTIDALFVGEYKAFLDQALLAKLPDDKQKEEYKVSVAGTSLSVKPAGTFEFTIQFGNQSAKVLGTAKAEGSKLTLVPVTINGEKAPADSKPATFVISPDGKELTQEGDGMPKMVKQ